MDAKTQVKRRRAIVIGAAVAIVGLLLVIAGMLASQDHLLRTLGDLRLYGGALIAIGILVIIWFRGMLGGPSGRT